MSEVSIIPLAVAETVRTPEESDRPVPATPRIAEFGHAAIVSPMDAVDVQSRVDELFARHDEAIASVIAEMFDTELSEEGVKTFVKEHA